MQQHFSNSDPCVNALYDALLKKLSAFGTVEEEPKRTCIHLNRKSALAGVYVRKSGLRVEFKTDYPIENPRIVKSEQISKRRWHHVLPVSCAEEMDSEAMNWLRDAWEISG